MKYILLTLMLCGMLNATTLNDILNHATQKNSLKEAIEKEGLALASKNLADTQESPLTYNQSLSRANGMGISGYEHELSVSKEFRLGNIQELEQEQKQLYNEAHLLEQEKYLVSFDNRLKNLYHQHCLDVLYLASLQESYEKFLTLYHKKEKAFQYDEIAKTELLQLEFEKNRLQTTLRSLEQKAQSAKEQLLSLTSLDRSEALSCHDVYPIVENVSLGEEGFDLSKKAYEKRIRSTQVGLERYSKDIEAVEVSMGYTKELETDIYTIGISIPLNLSSRKSEYERASLMHESSALALQNEQQLADKQYQVEVLMSRLQSNFKSIEAQSENIHYYRQKILPLMKKSYNYAQSSVLEYLLSQNKLYSLEQERLQKQKEYYATLFQLYSVAEVKEIR